MAVGDYRAYPAASDGVAVSGHATVAWSNGTTVTLVPASTITVPQHVVSLWIQPEVSVGPDTSYQAIFRVNVAGVEKLVLPFSHRADTAVGFYQTPTPPVTLAELFVIPANSLVEVICATSDLTIRTYRLKMLYVEGAVAGVAEIPYLVTARQAT